MVLAVVEGGELSPDKTPVNHVSLDLDWLYIEVNSHYQIPMYLYRILTLSSVEFININIIRLT